MNATPDLAVKSVNRPAPLIDTPAAASELSEQRAKNLRSFQAKYDAMLYIVEFIASFHLLNTSNSKQAQKIADVKSLVAQTRNGLGVKY